MNNHLKNERCSEAIRTCEQLLKINTKNRAYQVALSKVIDKSIAIELSKGNIETAVSLIDRLATFGEVDPAIPEKVKTLRQQLSGRRIDVYEDMICSGKIEGDELNRVRFELAQIYTDEDTNTDRVVALLEEVI